VAAGYKVTAKKSVDASEADDADQTNRRQSTFSASAAAAGLLPSFMLTNVDVALQLFTVYRNTQCCR